MKLEQHREGNSETKVGKPEPKPEPQSPPHSQQRQPVTSLFWDDNPKKTRKFIVQNVDKKPPWIKYYDDDDD